jgi:uncharacterized protein YjbJ (UPF0337 family)
MNEDQFEGGVRSFTGKVESAVGDAAGSREWRRDGVVDQVAGGLQHGYGRAKAIVEDAIDAAPELAGEAGERLKAAGERVADAAQRGGRVASDTVRDTPVLWALAAAMGGYAVAWFFHRRR